MNGFHGYTKPLFSALKNCINVCLGSQELYNSKHNNGHEHHKEGLYHIFIACYAAVAKVYLKDTVYVIPPSL